MPLYVHIRILLAIVVGLALTHLLRGAARLVQHPGRQRTYWVHLVWVIFTFLYLVHFWWWEFRLADIGVWTFPVYLFLIVYALLLYLLCALLFPEDLTDYAGYREYFLSRRRWFFGALAATFLVDVGDTLLKGADYYLALGPEYPLRSAVHITCCLIAMVTMRTWFQATFAILATLYQISFIWRYYFLAA